MVGVGRDLWRSSCPIPLIEQGCPEQGAQECVQVGFECLQGRDPTASLGSLCPCSGTHTGKKLFLMFRWNFPCSNLCLLPLGLSLGITERSLVPSS